MIIKKRFWELIRNRCIYVLHSFIPSDQVTLQVANLLEICIASWTAERLEECMDVVYVTNMTNISYQLNILLVFFDASSFKLAKHCAVNKVDVIYENIDTYYIYYIGKSSLQTTWNNKGSGFELLIRKRFNNFNVSSSSLLSFPCKWRASALKKQRLSLYGFLVFCS